jgi:hypothetical protein
LVQVEILKEWANKHGVCWGGEGVKGRRLEVGQEITNEELHINIGEILEIQRKALLFSSTLTDYVIEILQ